MHHKQTSGGFMKQLTVRNISPDLDKALRDESRRRGQSVNGTVLEILRHFLGLTPKSSYDNGLGSLAGSWGQDEFEEFERNTSSFSEIDEEVWR
jgi:hypothetical protein